MVTIEQIRKTYSSGNGPILALDQLSLQVNPGELFGIIGPDGAGKTTLFRILTTLLLPDSGQARVDGLDIVKDWKKIRERVGYMPGKFSLYQDLSVEENLHFFATLFHTRIEDNYHLIRDIYEQIRPFKNRKAGALSGGMKQKLALCCALIHRPVVLFLDEPTTGVDAVSRMEFWQMLDKLRRDGITILVTTPYMDEATQCDRILLVDNGRTLALDTPEGVMNAFGEALWSVRSDEKYRLLQDLRSDARIKSVFPFGESCHVTLHETASMQEVAQALQQKRHTHLSFAEIRPGVEDVFMKQLNRTA